MNILIRQVQKCRRFQTTLFRILLDRNMSAIVSEEFCLGDNSEIDYLLLPPTVKHQRPSNSVVDRKSILFLFIYFFIMEGNSSSFFLSISLLWEEVHLFFFFFLFMGWSPSFLNTRDLPIQLLIGSPSFLFLFHLKIHARGVRTKYGLVCSCKLRNCLVTTPHNGCNYIITGVMDLNGNSLVRNGGKKAPPYKDHFKNR